MSQLLSPTVTEDEPLDRPAPKRNPWIGLPKWILLFLVLLWAADAGTSILIQHTRIRGKLTRRLEAAFGRPVEVGSYEFSLWGGPAIEAQSVTVAEDPRFGHEYFLHTESLTVQLLWTSLLRGRIGLGTLSLTRPSLNLVRDPEGNWNISQWLPLPAGSPAQNTQTGIGPRLAVRAPTFRRIEISGGRINFKRGDEKLEYAFADVSGAVQADSSGHWRMDLEAAPWRAATVLQQVGTLHLTGDVGGTSSRLLPAALQFSWTGASFPDVLRLARGDDSGLRGTFGLSVVASTEGEIWNLQVRIELREIHRWDLALRPDNPAVNILAKLQWNPHVSELEMTDATIEAPHSNAHAAGKMSWGSTESQPNPAHASGPNAEVQILTSAIDMQDALTWARAFRSGISNEAAIHGALNLQMSLAGWPPRIEQGTLATDGAVLSDASLRVPVHLSPARINFTKNEFSLSGSAMLSFGDEPAGLHIYETGALEAPGKRKSEIPLSHFHVTGKMAQVRDLFATASLFGWNLSRGWDIAGPVVCDLQWESGLYAWQVPPKGFVEWGSSGDAATRALSATGASLSAPFLNQPIGQIAARVELKPAVTHVALTSAQAFGAHWSGTLDRRDPQDGWRFVLSADQLDVSNLNAWLNPLSRENFLDRMLPFLSERSQATAVPDGLKAAGHIVLDQFTIAPLVINDLEGDLALDGRHITLTNAGGKFFGGTVEGSFHGDLQDVPVYRASVEFSHADLSPLMAASPSLAALTADSASGTASFETHGAARSDLLAALTCDGKANVNDLGLGNIDLLGSLHLAQAQPGSSEFQDASSAFSCANGQIRFQDLQLEGSNIRLGGSGTVDFSRNLDLRLRVLSDDAVGPHLEKPSVAAGQVYQLSGTLASPQVARVQVTPPQHRVR